jgi:hypothetical protein
MRRLVTLTALAEMKSREEASTKNGRSEVANRHDGLGLGQQVQRSEAVWVARLGWWWRTRLRQTVVAARRWRHGCGCRRQCTGAGRGSDAQSGCGGAAEGRSGCGGTAAAGRLRLRAWRRGKRRGGARWQRRRLGFGGGGERWIEKEDDRKNNGSGCTVKKAQIRFSRDDRTRWSTDRTRWSSVRSESSKLLARPDASG